jgi:dihydrofolate reductase
MRKLKLQMHISLDGYVAGPNGEGDWIDRSVPNPKGWELVNELIDTSDTLLLGRKMAQVALPHFEAFPPDHPKFDFAQKMVNIPKVVFTRTLDKPFSKNTTLAKGDLADEIAKLKAQDGRDILVYGGAGFVSDLIAGGHIDEFFLIVNPVMINKGMRIFDHLDHRQRLALVATIAYENGMALLHHKLIHE